MGPTKVIVNGDAIYDGKSRKLIKDGLHTQNALRDYATHHYIALPIQDNFGNLWLLDDKPVYCFRGSRYETLDNEIVHLSRCSDCGGMGINIDEPTVERDCIRCIQCGHEFEARLEMMES